MTKPGAVDAIVERRANRADFVARELRVLNQDLEEITNPHAGGFEEMVKELGSKKIRVWHPCPS